MGTRLAGFFGILLLEWAPQEDGNGFEIKDIASTGQSAMVRDTAVVRPWIKHERRAVNLRIWQPSSLSGLLQTEAYALAQPQTSLGATAEQVAGRLSARMARQSVLTREAPVPPMVLSLIDEAALHRLTGGALIMADQLERFLTVTVLPNVTIQVVPNVMHAETTGIFALGSAVTAAPAAGRVRAPALARPVDVSAPGLANP